MKVIEQTHSRNPAIQPPLTAICIKASDMMIRPGKSAHGSFHELPGFSRDVIYASCSEAHCATAGSNKKMVAPMLKMYTGQPIMINDNIDVSKCIANGAEGRFLGIVFKPGVELENLEIISIDGYRIYCASAHQIRAIRIQMMDGLNPGIIDLEVKPFTVKCQVPTDMSENRSNSTPRATFTLKMNQFPINIANCRTVHKLQGRTINNLVISSWCMTPGWPYVALSRIRTRLGIFLRKPLPIIRKPGLHPDIRKMMRKFRRELGNAS